MHHGSRRRRALAAAMAVAVGAVLIAGCGDAADPVAEQARSAPRGEHPATADGSAGGATATDPPTATPAAALREAVRRTAEQSTYRMTMSAIADGVQIIDMTSITSADGRFQESTMQVDPIGEVTVVVVDGAVYARFPGLPGGKEWVHFDAEGMTEITGIDPSAFGEQSANALAALEQVSDDVERVGAEDIDGVATDHYRYLIDVEALMADALASGGLTGPAAGAAGAFDDETEMNVWVDADGLIRRVSYDLEMQGVAAGPQQFSYQMDFSDHGLPVEVTAPPPEATISMGEFMMQFMTEGS